MAIAEGKAAPAFTLPDAHGKKVMSRYGAYGEKKMYGKIVEGVIRSTVWVDPKGGVKKHWPKVAKVQTHPEQVLKAIQKEMP